MGVGGAVKTLSCLLSDQTTRCKISSGGIVNYPPCFRGHYNHHEVVVVSQVDRVRFASLLAEE